MSGRISVDRYLLTGMGLQDALALLARPDANRVLDRNDEELPVADGSRAGVPQDHVLDELHVLRLDDALDLQLRPQVHCELRAAVVLGDRLLPARPLHLRYREAGEAGLEQIRADRLEGLVPDVRDDHLHAGAPSPDIADAVMPAGGAEGMAGACGNPVPTSSDGGMNVSG